MSIMLPDIPEGARLSELIQPGRKPMKRDLRGDGVPMLCTSENDAWDMARGKSGRSRGEVAMLMGRGDPRE